MVNVRNLVLCLNYELKLGNAEIKHLDASINQHLSEVLIGMNTLKYFHITQNADTLTLLTTETDDNDSNFDAPPNNKEGLSF